MSDFFANAPKPPPRCTAANIERFLEALRVYLYDAGGLSGDPRVHKDLRIGQAVMNLMSGHPNSEPNPETPRDCFYLEDEALIHYVWEACD
jgi:hypothetical protein